MKNIRGIRFEFSDAWEPVLQDMFENIDLGEFIIDMYDDYVLFPEYDDVKDYDDRIKNIFNYKEDYNIIRFDAKFRRKGTEETDVYSYEEFLNSPYVLSLSIVDNYEVDIYCKDIEIIKNIYNNAIRHNYRNIMFITPETDRRIDI